MGGGEVWNAWRKNEQERLASPDLRGIDLRGADLYAADLHGADLRGVEFGLARLSQANLNGANLSGTDLRRAWLRYANLAGANLSGANLSDANLSGATLTNANLNSTNLQGANLWYANLSEADFTDADLTGCQVYGISAWGLKLNEATKQRNLIITLPGEPEITTDDIEVAQFLYLLIDNKKIRKVIDTITSKVALILGRFSKERKAILDAIRNELRERDLLPVIFDFSVPASRDVTETVKVLAGLARFVIADITDATEVRVELHNIIKDFTSLPVQPILLRGQPEFVSLLHLKNFPWLLPSFEYDTEENLLANLDKSVVGPAEAKVMELRGANPV